MSGCSCGCTTHAARQVHRETWWCKSKTEGDPSLGALAQPRSAGLVDPRSAVLYRYGRDDGCPASCSRRPQWIRIRCGSDAAVK